MSNPTQTNPSWRFTAVLLCFLLIGSFVAADHSASVTISPDQASCQDFPTEYTVTVTNDNGSPNEIREVRIYDDSDFDGQRDAGIESFACGPAPPGWSLIDQLAANNYCQYQTSIIGPNYIVDGNSLDFSFTAVLNDESLNQCGNVFRVASLDNDTPQADQIFNTPVVQVDCEAPIVQKMVNKPLLPIDEQCEDPAYFQGEDNFACDYWITPDSLIEVWAFDDDEEDLCDEHFESLGYESYEECAEDLEALQCNLGLDYCNVQVYLDGQLITDQDYENGESIHADFSFPDDSNHEVIITCYDIVGNATTVTETDKVDGTPPESEKHFEGPQKIVETQDGTIEWIDGVTEVVIEAQDPDPTGFQCNVGLDTTWYRNELYQVQNGEDIYAACNNPDEYCEPVYVPEGFGMCIIWWQMWCNDEANWDNIGVNSLEECIEYEAQVECELGQEWKLYTGPFPKEEESCHVLTYFSVDQLGNVEDPQANCFFVDKSPPELEKVIGQPSIDDIDEQAFPETQGLFHWVTPQTDITFTCIDSEPHPAGGEELLLKVSYDLADDGYLTEEYCDKYGGIIEVNEEGTWCVIDVSQGPFVFNFNEDEDSVHDLEYFCRDAVEKRTETEKQWYKVDSTPPGITKEMIGEDHLGDCPPGAEPSEDECYVADNGENGVAIWVEDGGEICAVDEVSCRYSLWWLVDEDTCEEEGHIWSEPLGKCLVASDNFSEHAEVIFTEDSTHELYIYCQDALGNYVEETEEFLVDSTPPETIKMYGDPFFSCTDWCEAECGYEGPGECVYSCQEEFCGGLDGHSEEYYPHWITSDTNVSLWAEDEKVGVDELYYRVNLVPDEYCANAFEGIQIYNPDWEGEGYLDGYCLPCEFTEEDPEECGNFTPVAAEHVDFQIEEESCHVIEYYSIDLLGNEELLNWQCVYVDNTPPEGTKEIDGHLVQKVIGNVECQDPEQEDGPGFPGNQGNENPEVGDLVHQFDVNDLPVPGHPNHCSIGVAFDGEALYYNICNDENIYKIDPVTADLLSTFDTNLGNTHPNAMAYDGTRNGIWFGAQDCDATGMPIYFWDLDTNSVTLEFHVDDDLINPATGNEFLGFCFTDGLAFNANGPGAADDEIWFSDDVTEDLGVFRPDGTFVTGYDAQDIDSSLSLTSGLAIGGTNLYLGNNGGGDIFRANSTTLALVDQFASEDERLEDMECDPNTFFPTEVMWVRHTPQSNANDDLISAFAIEPGTCGVGGEPVCEGETEDYVNQDTQFILTCEDQEPHPVDHELVHWRLSFHPEGIEGPVEYYPEEGFFWEEGPVYLSFEEDSLHNIEFYCTDALGNESETDLQYYFVDTVGPVIEKTIVGPQIGDCPPTDEEDTCIIDGVTEIHVDAVDPEPHPVGDVTCDWGYEVVDGEGSGGEQNVTPPFVINFPEESQHELSIVCYDGLWNETVDVETFYVDKTPPVTEKSFEGPQFSCYDWCQDEEGDLESCLEQMCEYNEDNGEWFPLWITTDTWAFLEAYDPEPHPAGVAETLYRVTLVDDEACESVSVCGETVGEGDFQSYEGEPFHAGEESCHLIEYYSVDNVEKTEEVNKQCVFVDDTPPVPNKIVGEPASQWHPGQNGEPESIYYEIEDLCWNGEEDSIDCWKVTLLTPISLDCTDPEPHPVDHESTYFMVDLDGEDATVDYCEEYGGELVEIEEEGYEGVWCFIDHELEFFFLEETEHNLKYFCEDALGNTGPIDDEKFKVEGTKFQIQLNKKWNLVSVPFTLIDNNIQKVLETVAENVDSVWTYDAFTDTWYMFDPANPEVGNLHTIDPGMGYWVAMLDEDLLTLGGSLFSPIKTPPSKPIADGWNLIGYYGTDGVMIYDGPDGEGRPAYCALFSLGDSFEDKGWTALFTYWEPDNPFQWHEYDYYDNLDPGAGYWVNASEEGAYEYTTVCPII